MFVWVPFLGILLAGVGLLLAILELASGTRGPKVVWATVLSGIALLGGIIATSANVLSGGGYEPGPEVPAATEPDKPTESEPEPVEPEPEQEAPEDTTGVMGEDVFVFEDGLEISVSEPKGFEPTETAAFDEAPYYVRFTVRVVNDTDEVFDPSLMYITVSSGEKEAAEVFDSAARLDGSPMTPVLPGKAVEFDAGFGVEDPKDLTVVVDTGDWDRELVIFVQE